MYGRTRLLVAAAIAITTTGVWVTATSTQVAAIDPVANPSIEESCGVDVTLVLDASGSISSAGAVDDVRDAAQSFLDSLKDTDSTARVTQFATASEELAPPTLVTGAALGPGGVLRDAVSAYYSPKPPQPAAQVWYKYLGGDPTNGRNFRRQSSDQYTNWDQSLKQAGDTPSELVVYITDGQPSAYDLDKPTDPFTTPPARVAWGTDKNQANQVTLDRAIEEANVVKSANTRMLVVGVGKATGSSALQQRLVQISGPQIVKDADLANIDSLNDIDVAIVSDFDDLAAFLRKVVLELCSPSLTITKLAQTPGSAAYSSAPGWSITAEPEVPGGGTPPFTWILPDTTPAVSKTLDTNANGVAQFQWEPNPPEEDSRATITEVLQPDYTAGRLANPDYRCELRNEAGDVRVVEGDLVNLSFLLDPIGQEIVTCSIWNSFDYAPAIALTKVDDPTVVRGDLTPPAVVTSTFLVTNPGNTTLDGVIVADDRCTPQPVETGGINVGDTNQDGRLDNGEAWQFTCTRDIRTAASTDPAGETITNNAEVTGTDPTGTSVMATANAAIVTFNPAIAIEKLVEGAKSVTIAVGDSVTYTFQVTNAGNTPLGGVDLVDVSDPPPDACPSPINRGADSPGNDDDILDVGEVWNYTCTASPGEGVGDVATVTATPLNPLDGGQPFVDPNPPVAATSAAEVAVINPAVELAKVAAPNVVLLDAAGNPEMVTYTFTATNPGNARLVRPNGTPTTDPGWVKDTQCLLSVTYFSGDTNTDGFFDPGETWVFTCDNLVSAPTLNVAEITAQPVDSTGAPVGGTVRDFATAFVDVFQPGIAVTKTSLRATVLDPNANPETGPDVPTPRPAEYRYRVDNTGNIALELTPDPPLDDKCAPLTLDSGDTNGNDLLDPGEVWEYSCSTLLDRVLDSNLLPAGAVSGLVTNTIAVVGVPFFQGQLVPGKLVAATSTAETIVIEPGIALTKTPSASAVIAGSDVTYTFVVSNTGDVAMPITGPTDDKCSPVTFVSGDTNNDGLLDGENSGSPESWTFTCTRTLGLPAPPDTLDTNEATVSAVDPLGNTYFAQAAAEVRVIRPAISLTKTVSASLVPVGTTIDYQFAATNTGTSPLPADDVLADVLLIDVANPAQPSCIKPTFTGGDGNNNGMLDRIPAEVWTYECSSQPTRSTTNIASVGALGGTTLQPPLPVGVGAAAGAFVEVFNPGMAVTKTASPTKLVGGGDVTYTYEVTNTGDVPLADVSSRITDDKCSPLALVSGDTNGNGLLDTPNSIFEDHADETWIYTCTTRVDVTTTNTVNVTGSPTDAGGTDLCDSEAPRVASTCDATAQNTALVQVVDPGQITIVKATTAPSGQSFAFTSATLGNFSLANGESSTFGDLGAGTYSVTEAVPVSWRIASIVCDDPSGGSATDPATGVASIALAAGESVTCTYTNHQPTIPATGSNSTQPLVAAALALVVLGAGLWILSAGRRRRRI